MEFAAVKASAGPRAPAAPAPAEPPRFERLMAAAGRLLREVDALRAETGRLLCEVDALPAEGAGRVLCEGPADGPAARA